MGNLSTSNLKKNTNKKVENFLTALEDLHKQIENFNKDLGLKIEYRDIDIYERCVGRYKAKALYAYDKENLLFEIKPIGACVIAAEGRADFIGTLDKKILVYLEKQHYLVFKASIGNENFPPDKYELHKGFEKPYWYIPLENKKVVLLDKENFCWLLEHTSGYKCS